MIFKDFEDKKFSLLGFGTMHLPLNGDGSIDEVQTKDMVAYAMEHGIKIDLYLLNTRQRQPQNAATFDTSLIRI